MSPEQAAQARELHRTLEFTGLRAQATSVGLIQLCAELLAAGVLDDDAIQRVKEAIHRELTISSPRSHNREEFQDTLRKRLDSIFPRSSSPNGRATVGTVTDMEIALTPEKDDPRTAR